MKKAILYYHLHYTKYTRSILVCFILLSSVSSIKSQTFDWVKSFGFSEGVSVTRDNSGNVIATGLFQGTIDFDPGPGTYTLSSKGSVDMYIIKLDPLGNLIWARSIGGSNTDYVKESVIDGVGNVYFTGYFLNTVDFDPGLGTYTLSAPSSGSDAFVCKLDMNGDFGWAKQLGGSGTGFAVASAIDVDASGNVYTTGEFLANIDFDPGIGTYNLASFGGSYDAYVSKLDANGNFIWAVQLGGNLSDNGSAIKIDGSGNVYTTGLLNGTADLDPGSGVFNINGPNDIFISKLSSSGTFIMAWSIGSGGADYCYDIKFDSADNFYITGAYSGATDFDPLSGVYNLPFAGGFQDIFIAKYSPNANIFWAVQIGSSVIDAGNSIALDGFGNIYATGVFGDVADFDPGPSTFIMASTGTGSADAYLTILNNSGNFIWAGQMGGNQYYTEGRGIDVDAAGTAIYSTGKYSMGMTFASCDFDPGPGSFTLSGAGAYVHKMNNAVTKISENVSQEVSIGPNPTNDEIIISGVSKNVNIEVYNVLGELILTEKTQPTATANLTLDLSQQPNGIYFIKIGNITKKIIKQ